MCLTNRPVWVIYQFLGCGQWVAYMVRDLEGTCWKNGDKERGMWIDPFERAKNVKIFVTHVNAHQKATSAQKHFNSQVDRMTHCLGARQPLSPATVLGLMSQVPREAGMGRLCKGSAAWPSLSKAGLAAATAERPTCQQQRPALSP